jgi:hypothetical protein
VVLAASHVIGAIGLSLLVSRYVFVSRLGYAFAALGALVPDFDFLPALIFGDMGWHRAYLNFIWIPFIFAGIGCICLPKRRMEIMMFSLGYLSHVILDFIHADILILALIDGLVLTMIVCCLIVSYLIKKKYEN